MSFFSTSLFEKIKKWSCLDTVSILFVHGRAMLAMFGSVSCPGILALFAFWCKGGSTVEGTQNRAYIKYA
jgi:hypothetical protein